MSRFARVATLAAVVLALPVGGCGWVDWPPGRPRAAPRPAAPPVAVSQVQVQPGDTVYTLAQRHGVAPRAIIEANRLTPPYVLAPGSLIVVPRAGEYVVGKGDTLYAISRRSGVDMYELARANGLGPPYTIRVGQRLRLPGGVAAPADPPSVSAAAPPASAAPPAEAAAELPPPAPPEPPPVPAVAGHGFLWPVEGKVVSGFGAKGKGLHNDGINIAAPRGAAVRAAQDGVVVYAGNELRGFGNLLLVRHDGGWVTAYAHNDSLLVRRGDPVRRGQEIARVGSTGSVGAPQLHFELRKGKQAVDPVGYLPPLPRA